MAPNLIERIQAKIELLRLEKRYTKRRNRRSTFVSNAVYMDGEYVYQTPTSTGSSSSSGGGGDSSANANRRVNALHEEEPEPVGELPARKLNRFSSMPGFGSNSTPVKRASWM